MSKLKLFHVVGGAPGRTRPASIAATDMVALLLPKSGMDCRGRLAEAIAAAL